MLRTYSEVVARALIIEREQLEVQKERNKNSRFRDFRSRDKRAKRPKMNGPRQLPMQQGQASGGTVTPRSRSDPVGGSEPKSGARYDLYYIYLYTILYIVLRLLLTCSFS